MPAIALYGLQAGLGLVVLSAGLAKLAGLDGIVQAFELLGLGGSARLTVGAIEVAAGLCLLLPRAGLVGALLLAGMVTLAAGGAIGQTLASAPHGAAGVSRLTVSQNSQPALCIRQCRPIQATFGAGRSWDI